MRASIDRIYYFIDEFCKQYEKMDIRKQKQIGNKKARKRAHKMSLSELLTIMVGYSYGPSKNFKYYYKSYIMKDKRHWFKTVLSYSRMVEIMPKLMLPLCVLLHIMKGEKTGIYFIDSSKLAVCHNKRNNQNRVFKQFATRGKSSMGWFLGFKLHIVINHRAEIVAIKITQGHADDRMPVKSLLNGLQGICCADKGYISQDLFTDLYKNGVKLVTNIKSNMKPKLIPYAEKLLLRKRPIIETVFDTLKSTFNLEHSRHRSPKNTFVHILATLVAYAFKSAKPKIAFSPSIT